MQTRTFLPPASSFTKAKKSVANFKLREGMPIGAKVTLRGNKMWEFLDRLAAGELRLPLLLENHRFLSHNSSSSLAAGEGSAHQLQQLTGLLIGLGSGAYHNVHAADAPAPMQKFGYKSTMQIPRLEKIVVNVGCSEARENAKVLDAVVNDLTTITGQKALTPCRPWGLRT